jgi:secondary thiamine-phosphate synthase enzyme
VAVFFENHSFRTESCGQFVDLTDDLTDLVARSQVTNGMALVYSPHTTCCILVNEHEDGFLEDFRLLLDQLVPAGSVYYRHDDMAIRTQNLDPEDQPNGHSHCRGGLLGATSQAIPIVNARLMLGQWQRVFFLELDRARPRKVFMQILGE